MINAFGCAKLLGAHNVGLDVSLHIIVKALGCAKPLGVYLVGLDISLLFIINALGCVKPLGVHLVGLDVSLHIVIKAVETESAVFCQHAQLVSEGGRVPQVPRPDTIPDGLRAPTPTPTPVTPNKPYSILEDQGCSAGASSFNSSRAQGLPIERITGPGAS